MREIRFRAWHKEDEKMERVTVLDLVAPLSQIGTGDDPLLECRDWWYEGNTILMQYTGLKDKNGKEIFESDVIKVFGIGNAEVIYGFHITSKGDWGVEHGTMGFTLRWLGTSDHSELKPSKDLEVIGNIWEHPHLLNK